MSVCLLVGRLIDWSVCHNFLIGREVTLQRLVLPRQNFRGQFSMLVHLHCNLMFGWHRWTDEHLCSLSPFIVKIWALALWKRWEQKGQMLGRGLGGRRRNEGLIKWYLILLFSSVNGVGISDGRVAARGAASRNCYRSTTFEVWMHETA